MSQSVSSCGQDPVILAVARAALWRTHQGVVNTEPLPPALVTS